MNTMLAVVGFGLIFVLVFVLLKGYVAPPVAFVSLPFIAALICGFSLNDIAGFLKGGMSSIMNTTILFVFSISFFTLMGVRGLFDPAINALTRRVGNNVTLVLFAVAAASVIGHLDGSGSTTYLIVIPAFLPLCKKLKIRPEAIFATMTCVLSFMNLIPWGGPTARAASVVGMETNEYFQVMLPRMAIMVVIAIVFIYIIARNEKKHGAGVLDVSDTIVASAVEERQKLDGKYFVNLFITIAMLVTLFIETGLPLYFIFMVSYVIALVVNYPNAKEQAKKIKEFGTNSVSMTVTLLSVGVFLGVLNNSGMMDNMASVIAAIVPSSIGSFMLIIFALIAMIAFPCLGTDAFYFGYLPLVIGIVEPYGISPVVVATTFMMVSYTGILSPAIPASYMAFGLLDISYGDHVKYSAKYLIAASLISLVAGVVTGFIPM